jgi:TonB family protein
MNCHDVLAALPAAAFSGVLVGWIEGSARRLIQRAARNAPPSLSERLEEEWLADLAERRGPVSRLRLAIGCCWATRVLTYDHSATGVPAASSATGNKIMAAYAQHDSAFSSRRTTAVLLIVCLHAALIYFLATGLVHTVAAVIPPVIHGGVTTEVLPHDKPPPPPQPKLASTSVEIPAPDFRVDVPADSNTIPDVFIEQPPRLTSGPSLPIAVSRVPGGPGKGFPNTGDYYPHASIRIGEKGVAAVRVCVDRSGRLSANPTIAQSSGSARLDEGALRLAKAGSGHYRATTEDGRPVNSCFPFLIRFAFRD